MLNVVTLNGGRGAASLIPALLRREGVNLTSIVNAYDDGKSTGEIRRFFDMLGPSDIRKVQELMLPDGRHRAAALHLFQYRYPVAADRAAILADLARFADGGGDVAGGDLAAAPFADAIRRYLRSFLDTLRLIETVTENRFEFGDCSLMNCIYAGAFVTHERDLERTVRAIDKLFGLRGEVLPNSAANKWLAAIRRNGDVLFSEAEIVELRSNVLIDNIFLLDRPLDREGMERLAPEDRRTFLARHHGAAQISPGVALALRQADIIVYSAGTQHSSLYPTYMSRGLAEAIVANASALKVFVVNIGADYETPEYKAFDYVSGALRYLEAAADGRFARASLIDTVLVNVGRRGTDESYVEFDEARFVGCGFDLVSGDFEADARPGYHDGDKVVAHVLDTFARRIAG